MYEVYETDAGTFRLFDTEVYNFVDRSQAEIVSAVFQHAHAHYEDGGWDEVVEAWGVRDVLRWIGKARTPAGAIRKVRSVVKLRAEYAAEIRSTAF